MLTLWLKVENEDLYLVNTCRQRSLRDVIRFLADLGVTRTGDLDLRMLLPHLDLPPWPLSEEEKSAIRRGEFIVQLDSGDPATDQALQSRLDATYRMELLFRNGTNDWAVGDFVALGLVTELVHNEADLPVIYSDRNDQIQLAVPDDLLGIGRIERLEDGHDRDAA